MKLVLWLILAMMGVLCIGCGAALSQSPKTVTHTVVVYKTPPDCEKAIRYLTGAIGADIRALTQVGTPNEVTLENRASGLITLATPPTQNCLNGG